MSSKAAGIILLVLVLLFVLSGGLSAYVDISVSSGNSDGIPDNGVSFGSGGPDAHEYVCAGTGRNVVCAER